MKEKFQIYASCEHCGLAWTQEKVLQTIYKPIKCPECKKLTNNFDTENHNKGMKFKEY